MLVEAAAGSPRAAQVPAPRVPAPTQPPTPTQPRTPQTQQIADNTHDHGSHGNTHITMQNGGPRRLSLRGPRNE